MSLGENQKKTVQVFVDGYNEWTEEVSEEPILNMGHVSLLGIVTDSRPKGILRARSADCVHAVLPASMSRPESSNEEYAEFFGRLKDVVHGFKVGWRFLFCVAKENVATC